jgi:predicted ester cyclase
MLKNELADFYCHYISCLNRQDWPTLGRFVHNEVCRNGQFLGLAGYRQMLEKDYLEIPDLQFRIELLVTDPPHVASRLIFDCTPRGDFLGWPVNGQRITFAENVFYVFSEGKIVNVWSVIDQSAIRAQLRNSPAPRS